MWRRKKLHSNARCIPYVLLFLVFSSIGCQSDNPKKDIVGWEHNPKLVGKWEAQREGRHKIIFEFAEDGHMLINLGPFISLDISQSPMSYHLEDSETPMKLDFVSSARPDDEVTKMKLIAQFITNDRLKIRLQDGPDRPKRFEDSHKYVIILQRVSDDIKVQ